MAGDGLVPPLNAPPAGQIATGVQPGVSQAVVIANTVIIFGPTGSPTGLFVYEPGTTPGAGNPPIAWITASTADPYGNPVQPGIMLAEAITSGNALGGLIWNTAVPGTAEPLLALFPDSTLGFTGNSPFILGRVWNRALPSEKVSLALGGGAASGTSSPVMLELFGQSADATQTPNIQFYSTGGTGWYVGGAQTDVAVSPTTVTQATFTNLSKQWHYDGGDAVAGTIYRLTAWGDLATPASALQACTWQVEAFGVALASVAIAAAALIASQTYEWRLVCDVIIKTAGGSGSAENWMSGTISEFGVNLAGTNTYALTSAAGATTVSTTASSTIGLQAKWAATETGQQVRYFGSTYERLGP